MDIDRSLRKTIEYFVSAENNSVTGPGRYLAHTRIKIRPGFSGFSSTDRKKTAEATLRTNAQYPIPGPGAYLSRSYVAEEAVKSNAFKTKVPRFAPSSVGSTVFTESSLMYNPGVGTYTPSIPPAKVSASASARVGSNDFGSIAARRSPFPERGQSPHAAHQRRVGESVAAARAKLQQQHARYASAPRRRMPGDVAGAQRFVRAGGKSRRRHTEQAGAMKAKPAASPSTLGKTQRRSHTPNAAKIDARLGLATEAFSGAGVDTVGPDRYDPGFVPSSSTRKAATNFSKSKDARKGPFAAAEKRAKAVPSPARYNPGRSSSMESSMRADAFVQRRRSGGETGGAPAAAARATGTYVSGSRAAGALVARVKPMPRPSAAFSSRVPNIETWLEEKKGRLMPGPGDYSLREPNPPQSDSDPLGYRTGVVMSESVQSAAARAAARAGRRVLNASSPSTRRFSHSRLNEPYRPGVNSPIRSSACGTLAPAGVFAFDALGARGGGFGSGMKRVSVFSPSRTAAAEPGPASYNRMPSSFVRKSQAVTLRGESVGFASTASRPCLVEGDADPNLTPGPGPGAYVQSEDLVPLPLGQNERAGSPPPPVPIATEAGEERRAGGAGADDADANAADADADAAAAVAAAATATGAPASAPGATAASAARPASPTRVEVVIAVQRGEGQGGMGVRAQSAARASSARASKARGFTPGEQEPRPYTGASYERLGAAAGAVPPGSPPMSGWQESAARNGEREAEVDARSVAPREPAVPFGGRDSRWRGSVLSDDQVASHGGTPGPGAYESLYRTIAADTGALGALAEDVLVAVSLSSSARDDAAAPIRDAMPSAVHIALPSGAGGASSLHSASTSAGAGAGASGAATVGPRSRPGSPIHVRVGSSEAHLRPMSVVRAGAAALPNTGVVAQAKPTSPATKRRPASTSAAMSGVKIPAAMAPGAAAAPPLERDETAHKFPAARTEADANSATFVAAAAPGFYPSTSNAQYFNRHGRGPAKVGVASMRRANAPAWSTAARFGNSMHAVAANGAVNYHIVGTDSTPGVGRYSLRRTMEYRTDERRELGIAGEAKIAFAQTSRRWGGPDDHFAASGAECASCSHAVSCAFYAFRCTRLRALSKESAAALLARTHDGDSRSRSLSCCSRSRSHSRSARHARAGSVRPDR